MNIYEVRAKRLLIISALTGFIGDSLLQIAVRKFGRNFGLKSYFNLHGSNESLFTATGMMTMFYIGWISLKLPLKIQYLAIYGIILDFLFRKLRLFSSLDDYYSTLNYFQSGLWGAIPMILPLLIEKILYKDSVIW